jgi:nitroreductase
MPAMDVTEAIRSRRTYKVYDGTPVPRARIEELLELATWAPCHRMTEPWRFYVVEQERCQALADAVVGSIGDDEHPRLLGKRRKYGKNLPTLGAFIGVYRMPVPDSPATDREDYAACCCAIMNMLLAATGMGLGSFWSTGRIFDRPLVREFLGIDEGLELVGAVHLGIPTGESRSVRKPSSEKTTWVE